ncbi:hypothetical protein EV175_005255 [Coemansia sp. RSA 1933]|nr:hypothetical protein EV175_005255 [Coemansia sp. RSA 1933]
MERSFYKTLEEFPILSGRLKANSNNRLYIDIAKDDLNMPAYTDTCCDLEYSNLRDSGFNIHKLPVDLRNEYGVAAPSGLFGGDITSAHFRIFRLKDNSGVLVYAHVAHYITDGYGYTQFMNRWAEISRWMQQPQDTNMAPLPERQLNPPTNCSTNRGVLVVSNQSRFPHYDVDFGAGTPSMVRHAPHAFTYTVYVMPANPKTGGGYEIEMNMPPAIEAHLVKNNTWMKLADNYDNWQTTTITGLSFSIFST